MVNNNKKTLDLPFFELCSSAPATTGSNVAMTSVEDLTGRYI